MSDIGIRQAQNKVRTFLKEQGRDWTQIDNRFYVFTHMTEEIGELARHIITAEFNLSLNRVDREPEPRESIVSLIEDDLGDILYHILKLAVAYEIDMTKAFGKSMSNIKGRYLKKENRVSLRALDTEAEIQEL